MKKRNLIGAIIILILLIILVSAYVDHYQLNDSSSVGIDQSYICTRVKSTNCVGTGIFIPTKTSSEWDSFNLSHPTSCITIGQDLDYDGHLINGSVYCPNNGTSPGDDCYDDNPNANPGQLSYFTVDRGDGSFDYNCDGQIDYYFVNGDCTNQISGWNYFIPSCGQSGTYCSTWNCGDCSTQTQKCN